MTQNAYTVTSVFQYATLFNMPDTMTVWHTGEKAESADSLYELFTKLGGKCEKDSFALPSFFNLVGQRGWDLIHIQGDEANQTYTFKRRYDQS